MMTYTAFEGFQICAHGSLDSVAISIKQRLKKDPTTQFLIFSNSSGKQMDLDLSGSQKVILERLKIYQASHFSPATGPGRPKLGVISREVSLLPQHWEWLSNQSGGASATIRRLVDEKIKEPVSAENQIKQAQEVVYRVLSSLAGNLPNYEDVIRFLYRRDKKSFRNAMSDWPKDVVSHTMALSKRVFE